MKICFDLTPLCTTSRLRGIGTYVLGLARGFAEVADTLEGLELHLMHPAGHAMRVVPYDESWLSAGTLYRQSPIIRNDARYFFIKHTRGRLSLARAGMALFHSTWSKGTPRAPGCKTIATCHDLIPVILNVPFDPPILPRRARRIVEQLRYRAMDHVIAVSECTKRDLVRLAGIAEESVSVIPSGVDATVFHPGAQPDEKERIVQRLGSDRPYFYYMGGLDPRKQIARLIESFGLVMDQVDENLVIAGAMSPGDENTLREVIRRVRGQERVVLLGYVEAELAPMLYRQATAHTLVSTYEGFGETLAEAFACGCPAIALDTSCIAETARDAAWLIERNTPPAIAEAMLTVARDQPLRDRLRARGLERARDLTWSRCARETIAVYKRVLGFDRTGT
jgi:glycosyltransferase involved in cell wall biosynthesis